MGGCGSGLEEVWCNVSLVLGSFSLIFLVLTVFF